MKKIFFLCVLISGIAFTSCKPKTTTEVKVEETESTASALDGTYTIDAASSQIKWQGAKPTGVHNGTVPISGGSIMVSNGNITGGQIDIDMKGIVVTDLEGDMKNSLEGHLKGTEPGKEQDFFNVDKFPKSTYVINSSTKLENDPEGTHMINGTLTIKDISKPVNFKAKISGDGSMLTATTPQFSVDRTEFDIKFKSAKFFNNLQDDFVNDEFKLEISVTAKK